MRRKDRHTLVQVLYSVLVVVIILALCLLMVRTVKRSKAAKEQEKTGGAAAEQAVEEVGSDAAGDEMGAATSGNEVEAQIVLEEPEAADPAEAKATTLVFTGDIYLSEYVQAAYDQSGISGVLSPDMLSELNGADITVANNEFPYSTRGTKAPDKQFTFRVAPSYVSVLKEAGVDVAVLANNHVLDFGKEALADTFATLDQAGIEYVGAGDTVERAGRLIIKEANGMAFGFLAASRVYPDVSWNVEVSAPGEFSAYDPAALIRATEQAKNHCDFLCVYLHWGLEKHTVPEEYQTTMAHALIDAGADAVIGSHPHVLQGVEWYNGRPIFYSLGNYVFYQEIERTAIAKATITSKQEVSWQLLPGYASNCRTILATDGARCAEFYNYMRQLSFGVDFDENGVVRPAGE